MKKNKTPRDTFTSREIGEQLNNAVAFTSRSIITLRQSEGRKRRLREFVEELSDILLDDVRSGLMTAEELVYVLSTSALFVHSSQILKSVSLPYMEDFAKRRLEDDDAENVGLMPESGEPDD